MKTNVFTIIKVEANHYNDKDTLICLKNMSLQTCVAF